MPNRWEEFTDDEIYLLRRAVSEMAEAINDELVNGTVETYAKEERTMCEQLLNELINETAKRTELEEWAKKYLH